MVKKKVKVLSTTALHITILNKIYNGCMFYFILNEKEDTKLVSLVSL